MPKETFIPENQIIDTSEESSYGVKSETLEKVQDALREDSLSSLNQLIKDLHSADVADIIQRLSGDERRKFIYFIRKKIDPDVLTELDDEARNHVLEQLGPRRIAEAVKTLETDDAIYLIEDLDVKHQQEVLRAIPAESRAILEEALSYPEDSAGRLMQREVVCVPTFWSVENALAYIRETRSLPNLFYNVYVVDPKHCPMGVVPVSALLRCAPSQKISEVMNTTLHLISVTRDQEEVAKMFHHYGLVSAPVVDDLGRIVGMVTVDDVVDVIDEEAEEDILHMAGVSESDFHSSIFKTSYHRLIWLIVSMINVMISVAVISQFEASIKTITALAFFMPVSAAMGGNAGLQVVAVIVRALTTNELRDENTYRSIVKEIMVNLINGIIFALVFGIMAGVWSRDLGISLVVGGALICNMIWAGLAGSGLPIFLNRLGMDPAISAGPLVTTITDVLGYAIYLSMATAFLL